MNDKIYIFGAHSRSQTLGVYLKKLNPGLSIEAYLVDNDEPNSDYIDGVPVIHIDDDTRLEESYPVYLGTRGVFHQKLIQKLNQMGMKHIIPVTPNLDMELRNRFLVEHYKDMGRSFLKLDDVIADSHVDVNARVYCIKSIFDKPLQSGHYDLKEYQSELQVGAALTDIRICDITDNSDTSDSISSRNKQFCELTGLYWIWKNATEDIIGLEHYRRHFLLQEDWKEKMSPNGIDVVLPTPLYVAPSLAGNYRDRHIASDLEYMYSYVREHMPEEYEDMVDFFENTNLYSPCNMFIMWREVLDDLCSWMFPILFACAEHGGEREDSYQNRYPGFLSERLMTFFFEKNREKYKVVYADKNFLS